VIDVQPAGRAADFLRGELAKFARLVDKAGIEPR
jgi:hypothetical protein